MTVPEPKKYEYIPALLEQIFIKRKNVPGPVNQKLTMSDDDTRRIAPNIAITPRPTMEEILETQKSRFVD